MGRPGRPKGSKDKTPRKRVGPSVDGVRIRKVHYDALMTCAKALQISLVDLLGKLADAVRLQNPHLFLPKPKMTTPDLSVEALHSPDDRIKPRKTYPPRPDPDDFRLIPKGGRDASAERGAQGDA